MTPASTSTNSASTTAVEKPNDPNRPNFAAHEAWSFWVKWLTPVLLLLVLALVIALIPEKKPTQAVATLAFITGAAVGIERVIEGFWNLLGSRIGVYWPMTSIGKQVHALEVELTEAMGPFQDILRHDLDQVQDLAQKVPGLLTQADADIKRMKQNYDDIRAHAPSNQRLQLLAASASQSVNFLVAKYQQYLPQLREGNELANTAISGMQDFLATFKDNPGRRLLSLYLGMLLGVGLAGLFRLDVFAAVYSADATGAAVATVVPVASAGLRVAFTGLLIGLGSNPTHEVIQLLQQYKQTQKGANTAQPKLPIARNTDPADS